MEGANNHSKLDQSWKNVTKEYKLLQVLGQGTGGQVIKAKHRESGQIVAVKKVEIAIEDLDHVKYVLREISILRQLSSIEDNIFTIKLFDVVLPRTR